MNRKERKKWSIKRVAPFKQRLKVLQAEAGSLGKQITDTQQFLNHLRKTLKDSLDELQVLNKEEAEEMKKKVINTQTSIDKCEHLLPELQNLTIKKEKEIASFFDTLPFPAYKVA